jgi:hypothetical protein
MMCISKTIAIALLATISFGLPIPRQVQAESIAPGDIDQAAPVNRVDNINNEQVSGEQIVTACVNNQADRLPHAFVDVPSEHWAFKAVQTMYYCGAYRQATPEQLQKELKQRSS